MLIRKRIQENLSLSRMNIKIGKCQLENMPMKQDATSFAKEVYDCLIQNLFKHLHRRYSNTKIFSRLVYDDLYIKAGLDVISDEIWDEMGDETGMCPPLR